MATASRSAQTIVASTIELTGYSGNPVEAYVVAASDGASIQRWVSYAYSDFGRTDGFVVNAGGPPVDQFNTVDNEDWLA